MPRKWTRATGRANQKLVMLCFDLTSRESFNELRERFIPTWEAEVTCKRFLVGPVSYYFPFFFGGQEAALDPVTISYSKQEPLL